MQAEIHHTTLANGVPKLAAIADAVAELTRHATVVTATCAQLVRSKYNVRTKQTDLKVLAALIRAHGLLQNLVGYRQLVDGVETGVIEIVAGGRRLEAIGQLVGAGELPSDYGIDVLLVTEDEAIDISLAENSGREDMHPADLYVAMQAMIHHGRAIEDVALRFELEVATVKRYLKLANISPRLLAMFRDGELNFEHMMAFALVDDHAEQESAWDSLSKYNRSAYDLRRLLTAQKINTQSDRLARYVGVDSFEQAGGMVERDLFSDSGTGYIRDAGLLEKLAMQKLEQHAKTLRKEGAAWVDIMPRADHADLAQFGRVRTTNSVLSEEAQQQVDELTKRMTVLVERIDAADENDEEELAGQLREEQEALSTQRAAILATCTKVPHAEDKAIAGAVLYIDSNGKLAVLQDAIRLADMAKRASEKVGVAVSKRPKADHSDRLTAELSSHRTLALQAEMMDQSDVALVYLTYTLLKSVLMAYGGYSRSTLAKISLSRPTLTEEAGKGEAAAAVAQRREQLLARLPEGSNAEGWLEWLGAQPQAVVLEMLAFCVANSLDATLSREEASPQFATLGRALKLDMRKWWRASAEHYFEHVSVARMVKVVSEAASAEAAVPLEKMKKQQAAEAAERAVADCRWLPELLRTA